MLWEGQRITAAVTRDDLHLLAEMTSVQPPPPLPTKKKTGKREDHELVPTDSAPGAADGHLELAPGCTGNLLCAVGEPLRDCCRQGMARMLLGTCMKGLSSSWKLKRLPSRLRHSMTMIWVGCALTRSWLTVCVSGVFAALFWGMEE